MPAFASEFDRRFWYFLMRMNGAMHKSNKYSPEVRERVVRMVQEHRDEYPSPSSAIESIAPKIDFVLQTLHDWVKKH